MTDICRLVIIVASIIPLTAIAIAMITTSAMKIMNMMKIALPKTAMDNPPIPILMATFPTLGPILVMRQQLGNDESYGIAIMS